MQSRLFIGSGKLFGQGLYNGTLTQHTGLTRLPEKHTDFIFAVAGEELGMMGCMVIMLLLVAVIVRCLYISTKAKSMLSSLVCVGVAGMLMFQTFVNIGMCIGVAPVIGITLPFFSYGGSSVLATFMAMGMVSSARMHPKIGWHTDDVL